MLSLYSRPISIHVLFTYLISFLQKIISDSSNVLFKKSIWVMYKMPQNIKQIATIGEGGRIDPLLGWEGCRKKLKHRRVN